MRGERRRYSDVLIVRIVAVGMGRAGVCHDHPGFFAKGDDAFGASFLRDKGDKIPAVRLYTFAGAKPFFDKGDQK